MAFLRKEQMARLRAQFLGKGPAVASRAFSDRQ
jgi:hypothetical protein